MLQCMPKIANALKKTVHDANLRLAYRVLPCSQKLAFFASQKTGKTRGTEMILIKKAPPDGGAYIIN